MNINFDDAKDSFLKNGYCSFNLKDFDLEFFQFIKNFLNCSEEKNLSEIFLKARFDANDFQTTFEYKTFEEMENFKKSLIEKYDWYQKDGKTPNTSQCWYYCHTIDVHDYLKKNSNYKISNLNKYISDKINNIVKYFYDLADTAKINNNELMFSLYNKDCRFTQHQDGVGVNYCSIIIYLNENYKAENGGLLLLNDENVVPEIGNVAIMDLSKHNIRHGVSKVTGGPGRFAILCFPILEGEKLV